MQPLVRPGWCKLTQSPPLSGPVEVHLPHQGGFPWTEILFFFRHRTLLFEVSQLEDGAGRFQAAEVVIQFSFEAAPSRGGPDRMVYTSMMVGGKTGVPHYQKTHPPTTLP